MTREVRLHPLREARRFRSFGTFDIETKNENFFMGGYYDGVKYHSLNSEKDVLNFLTKTYRTGEPTIYYAHNAKFDVAYLSDICYRNGVHFDITDTGGKTLEFRILIKRPGSEKKRWLRIRDSLALFQRSQEKLAEMFNVETKKYIVDFDKLNKMEDWEAYPEFEKRNRTDCEGLYQIMDAARTRIAAEFGVDICGCMTIAQLALKAFRRNMPEPLLNCCLTRDNGKNIISEHAQMFRDAYAGGRVEVFRMGVHKRMAKYDVNSMYPGVMRERVPIGGMHVLESPSVEESLRIMEKYEGFIDAEFTNDHKAYPVLWSRHEGKLLFMNFHDSRGTFAFPEVRRATEYSNLQVIRVHKLIYFTESSPIFKDHIEGLYDKRLKASDEAWDLIYKLLMNSLYGKFAQRPERDRIKVVAPNEVHLHFEKGLEDNDGVYYYRAKEIKAASFFMPYIAAYITSYARVELHKYICAADTPVYTDTDSVVCASLYENTKTLGRMKLEKEYEWFEALNAKVYQSDLETRAKGIPRGLLPANLHDLYNAGVEWRTLASFRRAMISKEAGQFVKYITMSRMFRMGYSKREIAPDGVNTLPFLYSGNEVRPSLQEYRHIAPALHKFR